MRSAHAWFNEIRATPVNESRLDIGHQNEGEPKMNIRQKIAQFAAYQRTVRELNSLTGRQLNDLGITREDIKTVARTAR
jgi:uncharacterized protein YjiS (DUF1127 family)